MGNWGFGQQHKPSSQAGGAPLNCKTEGEVFSPQFCSLREKRNHEDMMAAMEKENCSLREVNSLQSC